MLRMAALGLLALCVLVGACGTTSSSATADASGDAELLLNAEDGNTVGCTSLGGTCIRYTQPCPVLQQNTALCEDTILICCLPPGGPRLTMPEGGGGQPEAGTTVDATTPMEAASPMDSGHGTDAAVAMDVGSEMDTGGGEPPDDGSTE